MVNDTWEMIISMFLGGNAIYCIINQLWLFAFVSLNILIMLEFIGTLNTPIHFQLSSNCGLKKTTKVDNK